MDNLNDLLKQLDVNQQKIGENIKFLEENLSMLSKDNWDEISKINSDAQELSPLLDKLETLNKWGKSGLLHGLHQHSGSNAAIELLRSDAIQEIPK